jgi:hypothetical protein
LWDMFFQVHAPILKQFSPFLSKVQDYLSVRSFWI